MKLAGLRWAPYRVPFRTPYTTSQGAVEYREGVIVELRREEGVAGLGEAVLTPEQPDGARRLSATLHSAAPRILRGAEPEDALFGCGDETLAAAVRCALDTARIDAEARRKGMSVASLLGATASAVPVNALVTDRTVDRAATSARLALRAGYRTVKLKVGMEETVEAERERVAAVRRAIGPDVKLRIDPNGAWIVEQAIETIRAVEEYDIEYVEQPIAPGNLEGMARLQSVVSTAIAADEDVTDLTSAERLIDADAARVLVLKPQRIGGLRTTLDLIEQAALAGVRCVITTSIDAGVGTAATLHLAAAAGSDSAHGLATLDLLEDDLIVSSLPIARGVMHLPPGPGLGVELDEEALMRYSEGWRSA